MMQRDVMQDKLTDDYNITQVLEMEDMPLGIMLQKMQK